MRLQTALKNLAKLILLWRHVRQWNCHYVTSRAEWPLNLLEGLQFDPFQGARRVAIPLASNVTFRTATIQLVTNPATIRSLSNQAFQSPTIRPLSNPTLSNLASRTSTIQSSFSMAYYLTPFKPSFSKAYNPSCFQIQALKRLQSDTVPIQPHTLRHVSNGSI